MSDWNSDKYLLFEKERTVPAKDLADKILKHDPKNILDLGCGLGNSTNVIFYKFPGAKILGLDNSEDMIKKAEDIYPNLNFKCFDISKDLSFLNGSMDIVFSNACLQWLPDHQTLFPRLLDLLKDDGVFAVQLPDNFNEPIHKIIKKVVSSEKWQQFFNNKEIRSLNVLSSSEYYDLLSQKCSTINMWNTAYYHILDNAESILEWYKGTGLRPYLEILDEEAKKDFEEDILEEIKIYYPAQKNGKVIFKFPRLFLIAYK